jgi:cytochrome c-type biogenesis protein CcmE
LKKKKIRVGGMVKGGSISIQSTDLKFVITDFKNEINVVYSGAIPNLFEEGKGVVAEGFLRDKNFFLATKILAKHDENYMPPEVKAAIEEK